MTTSRRSFGEQLFLAACRTIPLIPRFRGRNRAFLLLFDALGLGRRHVIVETTLKRPAEFRVRLDLHSWLQRIAFLSGEYEGGTARFLVALHAATGRRGPLLDVGANVGLIAIPAAMLLDRRGHGIEGEPRAICVEAVRANVVALRENLRLSGTEHFISVLGDALGEEEKVVEIQVEGDLRDGEGSGTANILAKGSTFQCERIPLKVTTLDALFGEGRLPTSCSVMKIDTDGYDLKVLQGGRRFLREARPVIFGEFSAHCMRWHGQSLGDVVATAEALSYEVWRRENGGGWAFSKDLGASPFIQDLLLVPSEDVKRFDWCLREGNRSVAGEAFPEVQGMERSTVTDTNATYREKPE